MLESKLKNLSKNSMKYLPFGIVFGFLFLLPCAQESIYSRKNETFDSLFVNLYQNWYDLTDSVYEIKVYGQVLYSYYVLSFLIAGLILLLVLISVVYLVKIFEKHQALKQSMFKQLSRNAKFLLKKS